MKKQFFADSANLIVTFMLMICMIFKLFKKSSGNLKQPPYSIKINDRKLVVEEIKLNVLFRF